MNLLHAGSNRRLRRIGIVVVLVAILASCCTFLRISSIADLRAYAGMALECHPIWKQFAMRRFSAGDSAGELFRQFPPDSKEEFGRFGFYSYYRSPEGIHFTSLDVTTRDGQLLGASTESCTWGFTFFNIQDPDIQREYVAFVEEKYPHIYKKTHP